MAGIGRAPIAGFGSCTPSVCRSANGKAIERGHKLSKNPGGYKGGSRAAATHITPNSFYP